MLNTCVYIIDDLKIFSDRENPTLKNLVFSFLIKDPTSFEKFSSTTLYNLDLPNESCFSFYIDLITAEECKVFLEWLSKNDSFLFQYFFHSNYKIVQRKPVLFYNEEISGNNIMVEIIARIEDIIVEQGFDGVDAVKFTKNNLFLSPENNLLIDSKQSIEELSILYFKLLTCSNYLAKYIGINVADTTIREYLNCIEKSEQKLLSENEGLFDLIQKNIFFEQTILRLTTELDYTKQEYQNIKVYIEILKSQDESLKINNFYYHEYEILPLWYKKFGHILKVFMGKRSFRSLFDNNVKKYKD